MKAHTTTICSIMVLTLMLCAVPVLAQDAMAADVKAKLGALVDKYIASCEAKSALLSSNSENIRRAATLACLKASYCRHHRSAIVDEIVRQKIEPKPYKVRRFLSERFLNAIPDYNVAAR